MTSSPPSLPRIPGSDELRSLGLEIIGVPRLAFRCLACGSSWAVTLTGGAQLDNPFACRFCSVKPSALPIVTRKPL
jgi:hypothetical protein